MISWTVRCGILVRRAEVEPHDVAEEAPVLHEERLVEPVLRLSAAFASGGIVALGLERAAGRERASGRT